MSISWSDVTAIASELSSVPTGTAAVFLSMVDRQIDDEEWGDMADDGRKYLAAHLGAVYGASPGAAGPVTSESLGPMARSYGVLDGSRGSLSTTKYGMMYLHMLGLLPGSLGFVP